MERILIDLDRDWRELDLPHDYFAESDFSPDNLLSHGCGIAGIVRLRRMD